MSHYDDMLNELKTVSAIIASKYITELYAILRDEEKLAPEDCRARIEHDCIDIWSKATIRKHLPDEAKDMDKQKAGKIGGENKSKSKKKEAILLLKQNVDGRASVNLAENDSTRQKEEESRRFQNTLMEELSKRTVTPELYDAAKIIADKEMEIEKLRSDLDELRMAVQYQAANNPGVLFLPETLIEEIFVAISSERIAGLNLEHDGKEVIAVLRSI